MGGNVEGEARERGVLLFTSRMAMADPRQHSYFTFLLFPLLFIFYVLANVLLRGDPYWFVDGPLLALVLVLPALYLIIFTVPPLRVYEGGFITTPDSFSTALIRRPAFVPFERVLEVKRVPREKSTDRKKITIRYLDDEGREAEFSPLSIGAYIGDDTLLLLHVLNERVPDRMDASVSSLLGPEPVRATLDETGGDTPVPDWYIMGGSGLLLKYLMLPLLVFLVYALGTDLYFALKFYFDFNEGPSTFSTTVLFVLAMVFVVQAFRMSIKSSIELYLAVDSRLAGDRIRVGSGRLDRWFYRVVDPLPLSAVSSVSLRWDEGKEQRYLVTTFSNGEEHILPLEVVRRIQGDLEPGEDPYVLRYARGGKGLEGPMVRVNGWGVFIFSMVCLLVVIVSYLYKAWYMARLLG